MDYKLWIYIKFDILHLYCMNIYNKYFIIIIEREKEEEVSFEKKEKKEGEVNK